YGRGLVVRACREVLEGAREEIRREGRVPGELPRRVQLRVEELSFATLRRVINGTGVVIHTNLGRAPLSDAALRVMADVGSGYSNLEFDMESGRRGSRYEHVGTLLAELSGAEAGLVVNNNAAALVLTLGTLAKGREVVVSRAHLVEIGGGFRIPDIMRQSGATLREVGTTNRTYVHDFTDVVNERTALLLRVHTSNFRIEGFVHQPRLEDLIEAAHERGLLVVDDLGSGALLDTTAFGLAKEPLVQESVAAGADLVLFSGDKLLGGPQAGCIVGSREAIGRLRRHPLARALRVDKTTLAGLDATLRAYQRGRATEELPVWQMIARREEELEATTQAWAQELRGVGLSVMVQRGVSTIGGGSLPGETLPTWVLVLPSEHPDAWAAALRAHRPPVIARIENDQLLIDPRTVLVGQEGELLGALESSADFGKRNAE
ncbi:MAG: L-seryl-tRNA(Sec) selenium transferase, partial [Chloroflexota bacterium]|nr:L-seryl-tRNA(Sec) selenium transferase [Chloroflexota bacterium]